MENAGVRYAVISRDEDFVRQIQGTLVTLDDTARPVTLSSGNSDTIEGFDRTVPEADLVVIELGSNLSQALSLLRTLQEREHPPQVVAYGPSLPADALLEVMRAGASEYLPRPVGPADVRNALGRSLRRLGRASPIARDRGTLFAVFATTGGAGVTTAAVNLALELRALSESPTLLLDLSLLDGSADAHLDIVPRYTVMDVVRNLHRFDRGLLESYVSHHESGLDLLAAPRTGLDGETVTADQLGAVLDSVRGHYRWLVADAGDALTSPAVAVLREADHLILVLPPSIAALRSVKRHLPVLDRHVPGLREKLHLVLNRFDPEIPITPKEIAEALDLRIEAVLDRDEAMMRREATGGRPAALAGASRYEREVRELGAGLADLDPTTNGNGMLRSATRTILTRILPGSHRSSASPSKNRR